MMENKEAELCGRTYNDRLELIEGESWCIETINSILAEKSGFKKVRQGGRSPQSRDVDKGGRAGDLRGGRRVWEQVERVRGCAAQLLVRHAAVACLGQRLVHCPTQPTCIAHCDLCICQLSRRWHPSLANCQWQPSQLVIS